MGMELITENGVIDINKNVLAKLAGIATTECFGIVGMVNSRISDNFAELLKRDSLDKGVEVNIKDGDLYIKVSVVVSYGTRISTIAQNVIDNIKYILMKYAGVNVSKIDVCIQGVRIVD